MSMTVRGCKNIVIMLEGVASSLTVSNSGLVSFFIDSVFPSPVTTRSSHGVQVKPLKPKLSTLNAVSRSNPQNLNSQPYTRCLEPGNHAFFRI